MSPPPSQAPSARRARPVRRHALVFALSLAALLAFPVGTPFDSKLTVATALSLLREGDVDLDEYAPALERHPHGVFAHGGHLYNFFPLGPALVAVPLLALTDAAARLATPLGALHPGAGRVLGRWRDAFDATGGVDLEAWNEWQRVAASVVVALCAVVMAALARRALSAPRALLLTGVFLLCTPALSTASRGLWQHGPSMLFLALTLLQLVRARDGDARHVGPAGLTLALAYTMRPTNSVSVLLLSLYVLAAHPRHAWRFACGAAVVALPWLAFNQATYGMPLAPYFVPQRLELAPGRVLEALAGNLVSPARGLLVYTPLVLLSAWGGVLLWRARAFTRLHAALALALALHWVAISLFPHWWAGHAYGPRFFTDVVPYLVYFLVPVVAALGWRGAAPRRALTACFVGLAALSAAVHVHGASSRRVWRWNSTPLDVDTHPERIWDWSDPQFLGRR